MGEVTDCDSSTVGAAEGDDHPCCLRWQADTPITRQEPEQLRYDVLTSTSPAGPFSLVSTLTSASGLQYGAAYGDEDVIVGPHGLAWVVYQVITSSGHFLYIQQITSNGEGVTGTKYALCGSGTECTDTGSPGYAWTVNPQNTNDITWYLTTSSPCAYCSSSSTEIFSSAYPFGPWTDLGALNPNGCSGQNSGVDMLLSADQPTGYTYVWQTDRWVTNPNPPPSFDPNQYGAHNYYGPLTVSATGVITPSVPCVHSWTFTP